MKVTSFLVSSLGTEIKGSVQISDEGTLGGGLTNPLKLYTSGSGSAKNAIIEQNGLITIKPGNGINYAFGHSTDGRLAIGLNRTSNGPAYIDLIGDTTYTTFGLRIIRAGGTASEIVHRGTEDFWISTADGATIRLRTNSTNRMTITSGGRIQLTPGVDTTDSVEIIGSTYVGMKFVAGGVARGFVWWYAPDSYFAVGPGTGHDSVIFKDGNVSIGTDNPAGHKLRVNGRVLVDEYVRTKRFWELHIDANNIWSYARRHNEDGSYTQLYFGNGRTGSYFIAALNAILADMEKPTSGTVHIPASGGIRGMSVAWVRTSFDGYAYLIGKVVASASYSYIVANGDNTSWDGTLVFWT